jgi:mRNA interferase HigB
VRIIARRTLREFWTRHADAEQPLRAWYDDAKRARWTTPAVIKRTCANAS